MKNSPHIPFEKIADLVDNRLGSEEHAQVLPHIKGCERCSQFRARLVATLRMMRDDKAEDAPPLAISNAVGLFRSGKAPAASTFRRLLATLNFDSLQLTPAFGMRAGEPAERQLLFIAGENKVHLQVSPSGEEWIVSGQVLGACAGGEVEAKGTSGTANARLNESCEFTLPALAHGEYALTLRLPDTEIEIRALNLGA